VLFAMGKSKEALLQLQLGLETNPSLTRQFIDLDASLLQHSSVSEMISNYKNSQKKKK